VSLSSEGSHRETSGPARLGVSHQETERRIPIQEEYNTGLPSGYWWDKPHCSSIGPHSRVT